MRFLLKCKPLFLFTTQTMSLKAAKTTVSRSLHESKSNVHLLFPLFTLSAPSGVITNVMILDGPCPRGLATCFSHITFSSPVYPRSAKEPLVPDSKFSSAPTRINASLTSFMPSPTKYRYQLSKTRLSCLT